MDIMIVLHMAHLADILEISEMITVMLLQRVTTLNTIIQWGHKVHLSGDTADQEGRWVPSQEAVTWVATSLVGLISGLWAITREVWDLADPTLLDILGPEVLLE